MDTMTIALPGDLREFVEAKAAEEGHPTAGDYVRDLILRERRRQAKRQLEALLLKGLEGPAVEMTESDWDSIEREARERSDARRHRG